MSKGTRRAGGAHDPNEETRRLVVDALGTRIVVHFAPAVPAEIVAAAEQAWSDALADRSSETDAPVVDVTGDALETALSDLSTRVTLAALDDVKGTALLFHACGLALPDGRVVAFVGPSGRGKTTAARLLGEVYGYVSDESIAVRTDGEVLPYRKPLSVIEPGLPAKRQLAPSSAGLLPLPTEPLTLAALVLLDRRDDAHGVLVEDVPLREAILALVPQMSYLAWLERPLQTLADAIDRVGGVAQVTYADAVGIRDEVEVLAGRSRIAPSWRACDDRPESVPADHVGRADVSDALDPGDGSVIVLSEGTIRVLDGIAPALWEAAAQPRTRAELVDAVVAVHGAPADADPALLVGRAIDELVDAGLLRAP